MLEVVRVKVFIVQCQVRLYVIGKFDDFHIDAFFGKLILHGAEDFSVGDGGYAHFESDRPAVFRSGSRRFFLIAAACDKTCECQCGDGCDDCLFEFHEKFLL